MPSAAVDPAGAPVAPVSPPAPAAAQRWPRWPLWGLLALPLLGLAAWGLQRYGDTRVADDAGLAEQIAQADARNRTLEEELARKRNADAAQQCVMDAPPLTAQAPQFDPQAPAAPPDPGVPAVPADVPSPAPDAAVTPPDPVVPPAASTPVQPPARRASQAAPARPTSPPASTAPAPRGDVRPPPPQRQAACKPRRPGDEPEVVMIIDASGSMRNPFGGAPSRLDAAKRAAESMIRGLPPEVDVGLVDFGACGQVRRDKFYPAPQRGALIAEIGSLSPKQGTPLADAIRRAGTVASDSAESVLVIVSDGGDSCGGDPCAMARSLKARKPNVTINVIDLSDTPKDRQALQCIASAGGGSLLSPGDPADMNRKMKQAAGAAPCP
jgi:Mg-chelatase subunit ChlD